MRRIGSRLLRSYRRNQEKKSTICQGQSEDLNKLRGPLPRRLYLQLDNASENKGLQFLAFIAHLVEMGGFDSVKLSYLIVGHTHDLLDQWCSILSKIIKRILMQLLSICAFLSALLTHFKADRCIPKCVEDERYC